LFALLFAALVAAALAIEARHAARNESAQLARGAVEPSRDVYAAMRIAYPGAFVAMLLEGAWRGLPPDTVVVGGAVIFAAAKALKWWAIISLGPFWTFRVLVLPGAPLVARGPYRWLRHPNYVGVIGELTGVALTMGARWSGPVALVVFGILLVKRIAVESRALAAARTSPPTS